MLETKAELTRLQELGFHSTVDPNYVLLEKEALLKHLELSSAEESFNRERLAKVC